MPSGTAGSYNRETNTITLDTKLKYDANEALDALMHEVQHRVQAAEGFASGTNPGYWNRGENYDRAAEKYRDNRARLLNGLSTEERALYDEYRSTEHEMGAMFDGSMLYDESRMDALEKRSDELYKQLYGKEWFGKLNRYDRILGDAGEAVNEFYRNTAGEVEARDTTARRQMTAEERKNTPPNLGDADTVFADGNGVSMAVDTDPTNGKREPRYTVIDGGDTAGKESALADAYDKAVEQGKGVEISEADLKKYQEIRDSPEKTLIEAVKKYYEESLKGTSVEVTANDGIVEIQFENDGKKKSVGWRMKADKAATFEKLHQLTENAEYAYSEANRNENERTSIPMFHYFVNNARIAGRDIPVKIQVRDVITSANSKETHYYTHTLEKNMRGNSGPVADTQSANIDSNATAPSKTNIRSTTGNSQEKSSGRASLGIFRKRTLTNEQIEEQTRYDPEKAWAADSIREEYGPDADKEARKAISQRFEQIDAARTAAEETDQRTRPRNSHEEAKVTLTNQQIEKAIRSDSEKGAGSMRAI